MWYRPGKTAICPASPGATPGQPANDRQSGHAAILGAFGRGIPMRPVLFTLDVPGIGTLAVHSYGFLLMLSFLVGTVLVSVLAKRQGIHPGHMVEAALVSLIAGIIGSRLFYIMQFWQSDFAGKPWWELVAFWKGGLVFYGGLAGAIF